MSRSLLFWLLLGLSATVCGQAQDSPSNQPPATPAPQSDHSGSPTTGSAPGISGEKSVKPHVPDFSPPRSDRVNANDLGGDIGESSSKDTQIDLSPPENDARAHPKSGDALTEATAAAGSSNGVGEFHVWDPHKAAKSVEVGDFYFKRKNYRAAEDRYREALSYKDNDAAATFRLAECLEKLNRPDDARAEYESYLRILPHGPESEAAEKAIERFKSQASAQSK
jgi:tetratricopeptide (TPR) repeat protein